jgi:hypothetical membrane protein
MVKKVLGYILSIAGLIGLAASTIPSIREKIPIPEAVSEIYLTIGSIVLVLIGLFFLAKKKEKSSPEVPIYHGKKIVGYRRH